ncbi:hypothetical protein NM688_g8271 [Phlebia brevispora]|uniref:Uncharacterized protein n=1 Tax=Phlebia brevispora TaxID=194682 RepID=A0ACC1RV29_9APHY|nr:hypothetical protein NM688_g8271 [Phlebia brevispora]
MLLCDLGAGGLTVASQIYHRFRAAGKPLKEDDIVVLDAADYHYYQPGWTLVGSGLKQKTETRKPLESVIPSFLAHIKENVKAFAPESSSVTTTSGRKIGYESLIVATGLQINWGNIQGLPKALADPASGVSSIYSYDTCDKVWRDIDTLRSGHAVFTQPSVTSVQPPQKIMWMAWDRYQRTGRGDQIKVDFYTGMPTMFSVKKYSDALNELRIQRGVGGYFEHDLASIDVGNRKATFKKPDGSTVDVDYTILHVVPKMGPPDVIKASALADEVGWIAVDKDTLRSTKFGNVWAIGDCSSLPTSKTAAAITAQAPVLTENFFSVVDTGKVSSAKYDGYTSCPLLTGYGQLMLAEFKYGGAPKETFASVPFLGDQKVPRRLFYHFKKDLFPWAYWNYMLQGKWFGSSGFFRPRFPTTPQALTSAQIIEKGDYLNPDFDPNTLTVSQLLGVFGFHNINYPSPYSKSKLVQIFRDELKPKAGQYKKERLSRQNSQASDDGITDGVTGRPINEGRRPTTRMVTRRASRAPVEVEEPARPEPVKRRRSSAEPRLGGTSRRRAAKPTQPDVAEESEPEEPMRKVSRSKKKVSHLALLPGNARLYLIFFY